MKRLPPALTMVLIVLTSPLAFAASSTDLTVTGIITPAACMPGLSNAGVINYGKIASKDLKLDSSTFLEPGTLTLAVDCEGSTPFALKVIDNRSTSAIHRNYFGLGKINDTQKLGSYMLTVGTGRTMADGVPAQAIASRDEGATWQAHLIIRGEDYLSVAAMDDFSKPLAAKHMTMELTVSPQINPARDLDLSNDVAIDGSATLEMLYL